MVLLLTVLLATAPAFAKKITVDGFTTTQAEYDNMINQVGGPARFQLGCEDVTITVLAQRDAKSKYLRSVGVQGCGGKLVYVKIPSTGQWVANAATEEPAAPPLPAPAAPPNDAAPADKAPAAEE